MYYIHLDRWKQWQLLICRESKMNLCQTFCNQKCYRNTSSDFYCGATTGTRGNTKWTVWYLVWYQYTYIGPKGAVSLVYLISGHYLESMRYIRTIRARGQCIGFALALSQMQ